MWIHGKHCPLALGTVYMVDFCWCKMMSGLVGAFVFIQYILFVGLEQVGLDA